MDYDLIIVGGGLAGSSLATCLAERGLRVVVLERERQFRDRVRGEGLHPWAVAEARQVGIYDTLTSTCARELPWRTTYRGSTVLGRRDLVNTTPHGSPALSCYHPQMQEVLLTRAATAGVEIRRGVTVTQIVPGNPVMVTMHDNATEETLQARLLVGADGRQSQVRRSAGFAVQHDPARLVITGVLLHGMHAVDDTVHVFRAPEFGSSVLLFPLGGARVRAYFVTAQRTKHTWLSGRAHFADFVSYTVDTGVPARWFVDAEVGGPLATFEGADVWVDHPYRDGVVLVGDAAAASDPSWGNGMGLALRDVRVLRDFLVMTEDWNSAGHHYAAAHDRAYGALHTILSWMTEVLYGVGPEADRMRAHALPHLAAGTAPDFVGLGPDAPCDAATRLQFLGA